MMNLNTNIDIEEYLCWFKDFLKHFGWAFIWLAFILFFTYSSLFVFVVQTEADLTQLYYNMQCRLLSVFVNFGLLFMLAIDYLISDKNKHSRLLVLCLACFFIIIGLYGHARYHEMGVLDRFRYPFCTDEFSFILQTIFILILLYIRYRTTRPNGRNYIVKRIK